MVPARKIEPRRQRELMPVIARQVDRHNARILRREPLHHGPGCVFRAIVNQHDLMVILGHRPRHGRHPAIEFVETILFVVAGNDNRERSHGAAAIARSSIRYSAFFPSVHICVIPRSPAGSCAGGSISQT